MQCHYYLCVKNQDEDAIYLEKEIHADAYLAPLNARKLNRTDCDSDFKRRY